MTHSNGKPITLLVSSRGRVVLPVALRHRLGINAGTRLQVTEESDGLKLQVVRSVIRAEVSRLAGLIKLASSGLPRDLSGFDPALCLSQRKGRTHS